MPAARLKKNSKEAYSSNGTDIFTGTIEINDEFTNFHLKNCLRAQSNVSLHNTEQMINL